MNSYNELPKVYSPSDFEERIYQNWCDKGYFTPDVNNPAPAFSIHRHTRRSQKRRRQ